MTIYENINKLELQEIGMVELVECKIRTLKIPSSIPIFSFFNSFFSEINNQVSSKHILNQIYFHIIFEIIRMRVLKQQL